MEEIQETAFAMWRKEGAEIDVEVPPRGEGLRALAANLVPKFAPSFFLAKLVPLFLSPLQWSQALHPQFLLQSPLLINFRFLRYS